MARTITTNTKNLEVGNTVEFGNIFAGFTYGKVLAVDEVEGHLRKRAVLIRFESGGVAQLIEGTNATWQVVNLNAKAGA